jgi:opacity protein-like surface antigen
MSDFIKPGLALLAFCLCLLWAPASQARSAWPGQYAYQQASPVLLTFAGFSAAGQDRAALSSFCGFNLSAAYDYRLLPWLRGEVESGWLRLADEMPGLSGADSPPDYHDAFANTSGMLNLLADFSNSTKVTPFVGLGLGIARPAPAEDRPASEDGGDIALSYQAVAGVMWNAAPSFGLEFRGRYLGGGRAGESPAVVPAVLDLDGGGAWAVDVGLRFSF